jgi:hypothetical protein
MVDNAKMRQNALKGREYGPAARTIAKRRQNVAAAHPND